MSFADEYLELRKKRKKEEEAKAGSTEVKKPLYVNKTAPLYTDLNAKSYYAPRDEEEDIAPVKRTYFQKGALEEGVSADSVAKTILGSGADLFENLGTGIMRMGESVVDALAYLSPGISVSQQAEYNPNFRFDIDEYNKEKEQAAKFIKKDLYDEEKIAKKIISDPLMGIGVNVDEDSVFGEKTDSLAQSAGQLGATVALQAVGLPWWVTTGVTSFGGEVEGALNEGAGYDDAGLSAAISAGAEILTEKISGGIKFGGRTADELLTKRIARGVSNRVVRTVARLLGDATGEGLEEVLSGVMSAVGKKLTYADDKELNELFSSEEAWESFIGGAVLGGGSSAISGIKGKLSGVDYTTELTKNEQKVIDKVYKDEVAKAEKNGKVTQRQKDKIYEDVLRKMERGYIDTDTIEEVLGGDSYKTYKDTIDSEDALAKEYEELGKLKEPTLAERTRFNELHEQMKSKDDSKRNEMKTKLGEEVFGMVKGDRLVESYNEAARRGHDFEADLTKYDEKQKAVIQKAIDSGILNNTNKTHEFVDMIAKISADKGVAFDFTNNERLKESGFAVEGKTVNGYVTKDGVTLNVESAKALETTVGHEITHVLEGTEFYDVLQKTIVEYAKSKGDYQGRYDSLTELYKDVKDADVDAELTADLVGDYLFTDTDFINNLSTTDRNLFQKIWDEVKYLCKVVTAGSKEARELERVKKAFEDAYRQGGKTKTETQYSVTEDAKHLESGETENAVYIKDGHTENGEIVNFIDLILDGKKKGETRSHKSLTRKWVGMAKDGLVYGRVRFGDPIEITNKSSEYKDAYIDGTEYGLKDGESKYYYPVLETEDLRDNPRPITRNGNYGQYRYSLSDSSGKQLTKGQQEYFKDSKENPTDDPDIRYSLSESEVSTEQKINESMTMQEAKQMIQRAFVLGNIKEWFGGDYKNGDEWLKGEGAEDVALIIENEYSLQTAYLDRIQGVLDGEFYVTDILDAYSAGTLTGKVKKKTERINLADGVAVADKRFYAPKEIENAKRLYEVANQRITNANRDEVNSARAAILLYAHNRGAAETLGITDADLNKKLRSWSNYGAKTRDISLRINNGVHASNRWTGLENMAYISRAQISAEDVRRMVKSVDGRGDDFQNNYIGRTMMALDTHIDWSWLNFKFDTYAGVNEKSRTKCLGYYLDNQQLIHVKEDAPNTVAHEMGHALDYQWARELGLRGALTEAYRNTDRVSGEAKVWFDHFVEFKDSLVESSDIRSEYSGNIKETFARFVDKFVAWTEQLATGRRTTYDVDYYNDKFTGAQFVQFARLLQEKSAIDAKGLTENKFSLSNADEQYAPTGRFYGRDMMKQDATVSETESVAPVAETTTTTPVADDIEATEQVNAPVEEDIAPVSDDAQRIESLTDADAPPPRNRGRLFDVPEEPTMTLEEKKAAKLKAIQTELAENTKHRMESLTDYNQDIARLQAEYDAKKNKNTKVANDILRRIERVKRIRDSVDADYAKRISDLQTREKLVRDGKPTTRQEYHKGIVESIKAKFKAKGYDLDEVLNKAKNLSTFATVDNTPQRVMEKALGYKEGQILSDITVNQVAQNETEGIKWLNSFTDRKNGVLAHLSKQYHIKAGSKESAAAQMYAEGFYVDENNEIIEYGDAELAKDFPNAQVQENIKGLARDPLIRQIYDDTLAMINESRTRNAYPEIPRLDNYFLHFRAMEDTFSRLGLPFNPNDIRAKDLPTDLNGVTADLKPGQPYFASAMHRIGKRTSFDLLGGMERYLSSAKNQIYHIDDIQTLRALRNYIADTYGQAKGLENIDEMSEEEAQERIKEVYGAHLSTFAKFLNEEANILAGKTALIDRGLEGIIGRRGITFLNTLNQQVGSNMVGMNVSSSLTNILPVVQTFAKGNKAAFVKAFAQTVAHKVARRDDGFVEQSPVMIRRHGADRYYRNFWQKAGDAGYSLMGAVDSISTELIARTKYNELVKNGMDSQTAHFETDKWVSRLMGDRSLGQMPQLYNSKMLGLITKFQLEVRNQLDSQFYDTIQEAKVSNEEIENSLARNAKTAAKVTSTFVQLAVAQHLFGSAFESVAGYNPAFDIIEVLMTAFGFDDDEESEDTALDNIEQGFLALLEDLPYTSTLTGGRIPISSALPIEELVTGTDEWGNDKSRLKTLGEVAPYYLSPTGYGQYKKAKAGLGMFSDDHPIAGSYTDSGNLRFPVEDTIGNRVKAGIFGQYASANARDYFDNERDPLKEKQIQEFIDVEMPIQDYWAYRDGLKKQEELEDKFEYVNGLDLPVAKKNILINNIVDRKEPVDMTRYDEMSGYEEFDFYSKNKEKYEFLQRNGVSYAEYKSSEDAKEEYDGVYSWWKNNPKKVTVAKAVTDNVIEYKRYTNHLNDIRGVDNNGDGRSDSGTAKAKKTAYINSLNLDYGQKIILYRSLFSSKADKQKYNGQIVSYLNSRDDISYDEMVTILEELDMKVDSNGNISW